MGKAMMTEVNGAARKVKQPYSEVGDSLEHPECIMSTANSLIYTAGGRNYKKAYDGEAFVCSYVDQEGWLTPMLISTNSNSVMYYTDGDYSSGNMGTSFTVTFQGKTWYVGTGGAAFPNSDVTITQTNVIHLNNLFTRSTRQEYALAFLNYVYSVSNVARKVKNGWVEVANVARQFFVSNPFTVTRTYPLNVSYTTVNSYSTTEIDNIITMHTNITCSATNTSVATDINIHISDANGESLAGKTLSFEYKATGYDYYYAAHQLYVTKDGWSTGTNLYNDRLSASSFTSFSMTLPANANYVHFTIFIVPYSGTRDLSLKIRNLQIGGVPVHLV